MELALLMWVLGSLNSIKVALALIAGACVLGFIGALMARDTLYNDPPPAWSTPVLKKTTIIATVCLFFLAIVPDSKTGWIMTAGYFTQTAVQSETAKKLGSIAEKKLEAILDEIETEGKKKVKETVSK